MPSYRYYVLGEWARTHHGGGELTQLVDVETGKPVVAAVVDRNTGHMLTERRLRVVRPGDSLPEGATPAP